MEKFLTPKQISEWLQVSPSTVYQWTHAGFIPHYKISGVVRFKASEVEKWLNHRKRKGRATYKLNVENLF